MKKARALKEAAVATLSDVAKALVYLSLKQDGHVSYRCQVCFKQYCEYSSVMSDGVEALEVLKTWMSGRDRR